MKKQGLLNAIKVESQSSEWKSSLSQKNEIVHTIAAFANTEGGRVIVGVSDNGKIQGVQIGRDTIEQLTNYIHQNLDPKIHPRITIVEAEGKELIIIDVNESNDKTVLAFGRPYKRVGKSTVKMSKEEYERRILEKHQDKFQFDIQLNSRATLRDIDAAKLKDFLARAREERRIDVSPTISAREALEKLNLFENGKLTNTALLLFAKNPQKYFVQNQIKCARLKGVSGFDFIDMKSLSGTIPEMRENAIKFIMQHIRHGVFFDANKRYDLWEYPLRALEEILSNALAHRDYYSNAEIQISVYDDRIEVWNPGELPPPLKPKDLKKKHRSIPRNRLLANCLFLIRQIEKWGMGTNRIVEEALNAGLQEPEFRNTSGGIEVVLFGPGKAFEEKIEKAKEPVLDVNARQRKAIEHIRESGFISREQYMEINKVSHTTASEELKGLIEKNVVVKTGAGRYIKYELRSGE